MPRSTGTKDRRTLSESPLSPGTMAKNWVEAFPAKEPGGDFEMETGVPPDGTHIGMSKYQDDDEKPAQKMDGVQLGAPK